MSKGIREAGKWVSGQEFAARSPAQPATNTVAKQVGGQVAAGTAGHMAGKVAQKLGSKVVPGVGTGLSAYDAWNRWREGDRSGAVISALAAAGWLIPGPAGWAVGGGLDALNVYRDLSADDEETEPVPTEPPGRSISGPVTKAAAPTNKSMSPFQQAFAAARRAGQSTFVYNGKSYNTNMAENTAQSQHPDIASNQRTTRILRQLRSANPEARNDLEALLYDYRKSQRQDRVDIARLDREIDIEDEEIAALQRALDQLRRSRGLAEAAALSEGRMKEIYMQYEDYRHLPQMAFLSRYKMTKSDWWNKYRRLIQGSGLGIGMDEAFKYPKKTAQEKMHQRHQELRKKSGLPDPQHYKDLGEKLRKEIEQLKREINNEALLAGSGSLQEFAPGDGSDNDRNITWEQLVNFIRRTLDSFGFNYEGSQGFAEYNRGNESLTLEYDPGDPGWFGWALGEYAGNFNVLYSGTDPLTIDSAENVLDYVRSQFGFGPKDMSEEAKKGLYYYVNKRKKAGTSRPKGHPKAPSAQDWKDAAKTAKTESVNENDDDIGSLKDRLEHLQRIFDPDYEYSDDHRVWQKHNAIKNEIYDLKRKIKKLEGNVTEGNHVRKFNDYDQWLTGVDELGADKFMQKNRTLIIAQSWDGDKVGEFDLKDQRGWLMMQGVAEGLRGTGNPGMPRPYDQGKEDAKKGRSYDNPYDQPGEEHEHNEYKKGYQHGKKQGVAEGSLNEFAPDGFTGGDDDEGFSPEIAKMAQEDGFTKGVSLADGATLERAITINYWHSQHGGMYKQYFVKGFKAGRMNKIKHDNERYNLNLKLMKDGSIRRGEQGVAEAGPFSYGAKKPRRGSVADLAAKKRQEQERGRQPAEPRDQRVGVARVKKDVEEAKTRLDPKCWTGYKKQGTKMKGGVRVNNCVPKE